jgi:DNA-binding response OmpR family regulator
MLSDDEIKLLLDKDVFVKLKTLIVEDDKNTQMLYDVGFFGEIFDKKFVDRGYEAIRIYQEWHPDIIVLDVFLPEITGYNILKVIREKVGDKETAIIMATVLRGKEDVKSCMQYGIEGYIVKPFNFKEIGGTILECYAKRYPCRAEDAEVIYKEILKKTYVAMLLQEKQDEIKRKEVNLTEKPKDDQQMKELEKSEKIGRNRQGKNGEGKITGERAAGEEGIRIPGCLPGQVPDKPAQKET